MALKFEAGQATLPNLQLFSEVAQLELRAFAINSSISDIFRGND